MQLYQHEWKLGKRGIVWKNDAIRAVCFLTIWGMFLDFLYNIAQRNIKKEIFRVDIELYQHGSWPISVQNLQMLYYKYLYNYNIAVHIYIIMIITLQSATSFS
jgi:hypothetical protein